MLVINLKIDDYLSSKAHIRYKQILNELDKPIKFFICPQNEIQAYGLCGNYQDEGVYKVFVAEEIKKQDDIDHNFLHECLHLKQIKKGIPEILPRKDDINKEVWTSFGIELSSAFLDVPVEKTLKKWGFTNEKIRQERLNNLIAKLEKYEKTYNCNHHFFECIISIQCALNIVTYDKKQIININQLIKKYDNIISKTKEIVKIMESTDFTNSASIASGMVKVINFLALSTKIKVVSYK